MDRIHSVQQSMDRPFLDMTPERQVKIHRPARVPFSFVSFAWRTLFLPIMGIIYLVFCYVCHYRLVEVGTSTAATSHLAIIKAGVTSISIFYISLSLLPLSSLLSDLKSEEFFRSLADKRQGIRLASLNGASTPSRGIWDSLIILSLQQGSRYFAATFLAGFIFLAASALAPAALSVDTVPFDSDLVALPIGAVHQSSVISLGNFSAPAVIDLSDVATAKLTEVGSLAWAEVYLGINYSFSSPPGDQMTYVVPTPVNLTTNTSASWLSDVIAMQPVCQWIAPRYVSASGNLSDVSAPDIIMNLDSQQLQVQVQSDEFSSLAHLEQFSITALKSNWTQGGVSGQMRRFDTHDDPTDGSAVWMVARCSGGCSPSSFDNPINITFGPEVQFSQYSGTDGRGLEISFLYCTPNANMQTRRIHNDGTGVLTVGDSIPVRQGNLYAAQTKLLLSYVFKDFDSAGPKGISNITGVGNQAQMSLFFGNDISVVDTTLPISPIETITKYYGRFLQSGMKKFVDGSLGSAYVPSRATRIVAVFSSSMPHVIVSTVLYLLLSAFVIVCHFRRPSPQFTLSAVATSLNKSNIPPLFDQFKDYGSSAEDSAMATLGSARVISEEDQDGTQVLKLRKHVPSGEEDHEMLKM